MKLFISSCLAFLFIGCSSISLHPEGVQKVEFTNPPSIGKSASGQEFFLGGFSGLVFHRKTAINHYRFLAITDRGPNPWHVEAPDGILRPFLLPGFTPRVVELDIDFNTKAISVVKETLLRDAEGEAMTGFPTDVSQETPIDLKGARLPISSRGLDSESLVKMPDGSFWVGEEYEPAIFHFYQNGRLQRKFSPGKGIPKVFAKRQSNRGFEAMTYTGGKLYAFLQSPIKKGSRWIRVLEFDPWRGVAKRQLLYPLESASADKVGDAIATRDGKIYIVELDDKVGSRSFKKVFELTLNGASDISKLDNLEDLSEQELKEKGIQPIGKKLLVDLVAMGVDNWGKVEGLAVVDSHTIAIATDNDFALDGKLDTATGKVPMRDEKSVFFLIPIQN